MVATEPRAAIAAGDDPFGAAVDMLLVRMHVPLLITNAFSGAVARRQNALIVGEFTPAFETFRSVAVLADVAPDFQRVGRNVTRRGSLRFAMLGVGNFVPWTIAGRL